MPSCVSILIFDTSIVLPPKSPLLSLTMISLAPTLALDPADPATTTKLASLAVPAPVLRRNPTVLYCDFLTASPSSTTVVNATAAALAVLTPLLPISVSGAICSRSPN